MEERRQEKDGMEGTKRGDRRMERKSGENRMKEGRGKGIGGLKEMEEGGRFHMKQGKKRMERIGGRKREEKEGRKVEREGKKEKWE